VPGWYRYELASGAGNTNGSVSSNLGGSGGGCGAGEETYIISGPQKFGTGRQKPGNGGDSSTNVYGYGNRRLFGGKGHLEDNYYFINKNYLSNVIDYENLAGGDAFSDNNQWKAGKSLMGGTGYDNSQPGTNGGNTLYYGGGGAGGTCNDVYSIYYENGAGGAVAKNCLLLNGTFYHNGGSMIIHIGGNGFNGGNGGRGYNDVGINSGVYGGAGGNGGAPGWYREYGESSAGYAKLYYLGQ
jgi:hypothetical protein